MSIRFAEGGRERILQQGMTLAGSEDRARAEAVLDALVSLSAAWCGRETIPEQMEGMLAALLCRQLQGENGRAVTSVKRGDTTITYAQEDQATMERLLAPFVRLRSPEKRRWV